MSHELARSAGVAEPTAAETTFVWFLRVISAYSLMFGALYWVRLIGFYDAPLWRFDLMPVYWQVAATILAVFYPFAAIGLWMLVSWGPVIWAICAMTEIVMYVGFPDLFGSRMAVIVSHAFVALVYLAFRLVIFLQKRQSERQG
ncbi:DUF6163 family protein [Pseudaminobacter salicylatoxidans]|uniref:DUF6163 family protein n=1 Tax=Pseudaminobacter salicylatoxidans TaxID=93369 RepID=UPI00030E2AB6|nr:DUF6163 family protein [Pseudaminobacter salicylatoxidans]